MPTDIKLKNSVTATNAPTSLQQGEVAINITDKKVWVGNAATTPVLLLGSGADGTFTNLTVSGVASFADGTVSLPSITNIGDTNTGIFFPAADTIAFTEGGVESMRIDASGNVAIGATSTTTKLRVYSAGDSPFLAESATGSSFLLVRNSNGTAGIASTSDNLILYTTSSGTERMRISAAGDVGIGTTTPSSFSTKLVVSQAASVYGDERKVVSLIDTTALATGVGAGISFWGTSESGGGISQFGSIKGVKENATSANYAGGLAFVTSNSSNVQTERMRIDSSGNVGIGTASPAMGLHVVKNWSSGKATVGAQTVTSFASGGIAGFGCFDSDGSRALHLYSDNNAAYAINTKNTALVLGTNDTERMRITAGGDIGINNSSPANRLDVIGSTGADACQIKTTNSSTAINLILWNAVSSGDNVFTRFATDTTLTARGSIDYNRAGGQVRYNTTSDERLKENIVDSSSALPLINAVKIRSFNWKETGFYVEHGVIAQELQIISPDSVSVGQDNEDGTIKQPWGVDTATLVPAMIKAMQEQQALIENLTTRLNALEGK